LTRTAYGDPEDSRRTCHLGLEVLRRAGADVALQKSREDVRLSDGLGVFRGVSADLSQRPGSGRLDVVFWLLGESDRQHPDALRVTDSVTVTVKCNIRAKTPVVKLHRNAFHEPEK